MNARKWIGALVVVVVMVFVITFASVYIGTGRDNAKKPEKNATEDRLALTFVTPLIDRENPEILDVELNQPGTNDFWFQNDNPGTVEVGLASLKSRHVKIYLVPEEKTIPLVTLAAAEVGTCSLGELPLTAALPALRALQLSRLEEDLTPTELHVGKNSVTVPPGGVGWMRINWVLTQPGLWKVGGWLWIGSKENNHNPVGLVARTQPALRAPSDWTLRTASAEQLPRQFSFPCWSSTRLHFRVKARIRGGAAADPIVVGEPVPLSREEMRQLEEENNREPASKNPDRAREALRGRVLFGYRIPLTLNPTYAGGKQAIDLGPFERRVELSSDDEGMAPVTVRVRGRVEGEVRVSPEDEVDFGDFDRRKEVPVGLTLVSSEEGLELEVDPRTERTASFADVQLKKKHVDRATGTQSWPLRVAIRPDQARGHFPRADDAMYQDSAVYLKLRYRDKGKAPRILRIPLSGTAMEGL